MPKRKRNEETAEERLARRGVALERIDDLVVAECPLVPPLSLNQQQFLPRLIGWYQQFAAKLSGGGHSVGGVIYTDWEDATGPTAPTWGPKAFKTFLLFLSRREGQSDGKLAQSTFFGNVTQLISLYNRQRRIAQKETLSDDTLKGIWELAVTFGKQLPKERTPRLQIRPEGIVAMICNLPTLGHSMRRMLSYILYISISAACGFRYGTLCHGSKVAWDQLPDNRRGLRWRTTVLWVTPGTDNTNDIVGYVSPEHVKNGAHTFETFFPLVSTPVLGASANWMLVLALFLDTGRSVEEFSKLLDPSFLGPERRPRRLHIPHVIGDKFLVATSDSTSASHTTITRMLKSVSRLSGFDGDITSHAFRHYVGNKVFQARGIDAARRMLQHKRGASTRYYISPILPSYVSEALFGDHQDDRLAEKIRAAGTRPDAQAPKPANLAVHKERLAKIKEAPELVALQAEQGQIKKDIVQEFGTLAAAPPKLQKRFRACANKYAYVLQKLCDTEFTDLRKAYMEKKHRALQQGAANHSSAGDAPESFADPDTQSTDLQFDLDAFDQALADDQDADEEDDIPTSTEPLSKLLQSPWTDVLDLARLVLDSESEDQ